MESWLGGFGSPVVFNYFGVRLHAVFKRLSTFFTAGADHLRPREVAFVEPFGNLAQRETVPDERFKVFTNFLDGSRRLCFASSNA